MMEIKDMTDKQLIEEFEQYDQMINQVQCFGTKDLYWFEDLRREINSRGFDIISKSEVVR